MYSRLVDSYYSSCGSRGGAPEDISASNPCHSITTTFVSEVLSGASLQKRHPRNVPVVAADLPVTPMSSSILFRNVRPCRSGKAVHHLNLKPGEEQGELEELEEIRWPAGHAIVILFPPGRTLEEALGRNTVLATPRNTLSTVFSIRNKHRIL